MTVETEQFLISAETTARLLGISRSAFYSLLSSGRIGPLPVRLGRSVRWRIHEIRDWVESGCPPHDRWQAVRGTENA